MAARGYGYLAYCALLAQAGAWGCVDDGVSLHVICPVQPEIEDNVCVYDAASETCVLSGVMNLAATSYYNQNLRVESGLKSRAREVPPLGESNGIQVHSARIELRTAEGQRIEFANGVKNPFDVVSTGYITPGGANAITVNLITPAHAEQLMTKQDPVPTAPVRSQIVVAVKIRGKTSGDVDVEAGEYLWPVRLISVSPQKGANECISIGACADRIGQDDYARACLD